MARRRTKLPSKSRRKPRARKPESSLFYFPGWRLVGRIILIVTIIGILTWQWPNLTAWAANIKNETVRLFGWGLPLIIIAIGILSGITWWQKHRPLIHRFRYWLAGIAFIVAIWGILGFSNRGGSIGLAITGQDITGYPVFLSTFRLAGLFFVGTILVAPKACLRAGKEAASWLHEQIQKQLQKRAAPRPTPEDVWKKYGETPDLIAVDGWLLPPIDILDRAPEVELSQADNTQRARLIEEALASYSVEAKVE